MRISDWSSDVCSSDLLAIRPSAVSWPWPPISTSGRLALTAELRFLLRIDHAQCSLLHVVLDAFGPATHQVAQQQIGRAHTELQSLMRISYAVFCLKKKKNHNLQPTHHSISYNLNYNH